jgi:hypothetical protein
MSTAVQESNSTALTVYPEVKKHDSLLLAELLCTLEKIHQYEPEISDVIDTSHERIIILEHFKPLVVQIKIRQHSYKSFNVTTLVDGREFFKYDMPLFVKNNDNSKIGVFSKMMEKVTKEKQKKSDKLNKLKETNLTKFVEAFVKIEHNLLERAESKKELFQIMTTFVNASQLPEDELSTSFYYSQPTSSFFDGKFELEIGYVPNIGYSFVISGATFKNVEDKDSIIEKMRSHSETKFFSDETFTVLSSNGVMSLNFSNVVTLESLESLLNFLFNDR